MAKLLCSLVLAGFVLAANAFSFDSDSPPPNPVEDTFDWINPFKFVHNIASFLNPFNWVSNFPFWNPFSYLPNISDLLNPVYWAKKIFHLYNPFSWIPSFLNPFHYFNIPNPFKYLPGIGNHKCTLQAERGPCKGRMERYYYDQNTKACMKFDYGGCKGNRNNFQTRHECEKACRGH